MHFTINLDMPDNGEQYLVEMSNATLTNIKGRQAKNADLTITMNRADLETMMVGQATFDDLVKTGKVKLAGNPQVVDQLRSVLVQFTPTFELMAGTIPGADAADERANPFKQEAPATEHD